MEGGLDLDFSWALQDSRANRQIVTRLDGCEQFRNLIQGSCSVGVHEKDKTALGVEHPGADCGAFAHMRGGERADPDVAFLEETCKSQSLVPAAVVHNDELEIE